jgi:ADP-ribose pyrophosphatase YjhB (NUDIX family)
VLLMWRHRFVTDTNGWGIPIGTINSGEDPADAAARETEEEAGWRPGPLRFLLRVEPTPGLSDSVHHIYIAGGQSISAPRRTTSSPDQVAWVPLADVPSLIGRGEVTSGTTLAALLHAVACGSARSMRPIQGSVSRSCAGRRFAAPRVSVVLA